MSTSGSSLAADCMSLVRSKALVRTHAHETTEDDNRGIASEWIGGSVQSVRQGGRVNRNPLR